MDPLVSVVIPVYNNEKLVERCISSVLMQSYNSLEIVIVNDGSTDGTQEILETFSNEEKVRVISIKNNGVSAARNTGIKFSRGKYLYFLDSDDFLLPNALMELIDISIKESSPIVIGSLSKDNQKNTDYRVFYSKEYSDDLIQKILTNEISRTACGILFKKNIIFENNLTFPLFLPYGEDFLFTIKFLMDTNSGIYFDNKNYIVEEREFSASRKFDLNHYEKILKVEENFRHINQSNRISNKYFQYFLMTETILSFEKVLKSNEKYKVKKKKFQEIKSQLVKKIKLNKEIYQLQRKTFRKYILVSFLPYFLITILYSIVLKENFIFSFNANKQEVEL